MLQAHTIKSASGSRKRPKRVGRGNASGHGTTATRGTKGQRARSGGSKGLKRLGYKVILQRIPKQRGFKSHAPRLVALTLAQLEHVFSDGEKITLEKLMKRGLLSKGKAAKILAAGTVSKKFIVEGIAVSAGARAALEKAGGSVLPGARS